MIDAGVDRIGSVILSGDGWKIPAIKDAVSVSRNAGIRHSLIPLFNEREILFQTIEYYQPHIIHFCESFTGKQGRMIDPAGFVDLQKALKVRFPEVEIMRSIPVAVPESDLSLPTMEIAAQFEASSDYFLTDTSLDREPVEGFIGITGQTSDWQVVRKLAQQSAIPVILAGGLSPENVYEAIMSAKPSGVDSCTQTNAVNERGKPIRFKKDEKRVRAFVNEARRAEREIGKGRAWP